MPRFSSVVVTGLRGGAGRFPDGVGVEVGVGLLGPSKDALSWFVG